MQSVDGPRVVLARRYSGVAGPVAGMARPQSAQTNRRHDAIAVAVNVTVALLQLVGRALSNKPTPVVVPAHLTSGTDTAKYR